MTKKLDEYTKEELIEAIKSLKKRKKFGLVWEDKIEQVVTECFNKLPVLEEVNNRYIEASEGPTSLIIEGDNYHSLSVLNYTHYQKVDAIYADPPYNTGSNTWVYNNKIIDGNDTFRHSKWLSFMNKRLILAKKLLKDTGIIVVTIDDYEVATLTLLLDQIFGEVNRIGVVVVENNPRGRTSNKFYATSHEYYLVYAKDATKANIYNLPLSDEQKNAFRHEDDESKYRLLPLRKSGAASRRSDRPKQYYPIYIDPDTLNGSLEPHAGWDELYPIDESGADRVWKIGLVKCSDFLNNGMIVIKKSNGKYSLNVKDRIKEGRKPKTVWVNPLYDASSHGATLLLNMFGEKLFDYPKSIWAVRDFLYTLVGENKEATVLDFFAGSGTTGHAVMQLNKEDNGKRKFILCTNNENGIAENITYERIKKIAQGYKSQTPIPTNIRYFKTDFVNKEKTDDQTRISLVERCTDMIRIREDAYTPLINENDLKLFASNDHNAAILFDPHCIDDCIRKIEKIDAEKPLNMYIFSYSNYAYEEDVPETRLKYTICPIPESILEVYKRIFKEEIHV